MSFAIFENRVEAGKALAKGSRGKGSSRPCRARAAARGCACCGGGRQGPQGAARSGDGALVGASWQPELAAAAVIDGEDAQTVVNEEVCGLAGVSRSYIDEMAKQELVWRSTAGRSSI